MSALEGVRQALERRDCNPRGPAERFSARCPAHDDGNPSLSVGQGDKGAVLNCHTGCDTGDVLDALGLRTADLFDAEAEDVPRCDHQRPWKWCDLVATYDYTDAEGDVLYTQRRYRCPACGGKTFRPYDPKRGRSGLPKGVRVLYRLPEVLLAPNFGATVYVVEGEKDADRLAALGCVATTNANGAKGKWEASYTEALTGAEVVVIADNDGPGAEHARTVAAALDGAATSVRTVRGALDAEHADVSDHLDAGYGLGDLVDLGDEAPEDGPAPTAEDGAEDAGAPRRVRSQPVAKIPPRRRQFLWRHRLPLGEVTLWVGHAGIGKSQAAVWLAARVSRGELDGELHGSPAPVLYLGTEDSWEFTLAPRFAAAGADLDRVHRLYAETEEGHEATVSLAVDLPALRTEIEETGARLVILDALLSTFGSAKLTEQATVRRHMEPLARLAQGLNIAVVGVAHFRKASDSNPLHMVSGSAEFGQVVRSAIGFATDPEAEDGSCVMSVIKRNLAPDVRGVRYRIDPAAVDTDDGPTDVGRFVMLGECDQDVGELLNQDPSSAEDRTDRAEAGEWLRAYLADNGGEAIAGDVLKDAEKAGFAKHTVQRARKRAGIKSQKSSLKGGWAWVVPTANGGAEGDKPSEGDTEDDEDDRSRALSPSSPSQSPSPPDPAPDPSGASTCLDCPTPVPAGVVRCRKCFNERNAA